jgi:hypothetical protein
MEDSLLWTSHLDVELSELNIRYKKDMPGLFELGVDVPLVRATGGFLDRPLAWYHRAFGFPDYNRSDRPQNHFLYEIRRNGALLIRGENDRAGVGDMRVTFKKTIMEIPVTAGLLAAFELPTGNARIGYGNGSLDSSLAFLLDYHLNGDTLLSGNVGVVFPGDLKAHQRVGLRTFFYGGTAVEYLFLDDLSVLVQFMMQSSPYPETGISQIDRTGMLLVLGGRYYAGAGSLEFSLSEDPNTSGAPDFALNVTYKYGF